MTHKLAGGLFLVVLLSGCLDFDQAEASFCLDNPICDAAGDGGHNGGPDGGENDAGVDGGLADSGTDGGAADAGMDAGAPTRQLSVRFTGTGSGTVSWEAGGSCTSDCQKWFPQGAALTLTATASTGSSFVSWAEDCSVTTDTCKLTLDDDRAATAHFDLLDQLTVEVESFGGGQGRVVSLPAGAIDCPGDCSEPTSAGTTTLRAEATADSSFSHWDGACAGQIGDCTVTPPAYVKATFVVTPNYMFVTSQATSGDMGGVPGADALCNNLAGAAQLPGTFVAWLPSSTESAVQRLRSARGWIRRDGRPFADSIQALLTVRQMFHPAGMDETGAFVTSVARAYTGTTAQGTTAGTNCNFWTTDASSAAGETGEVFNPTNKWTSVQSLSCDRSFPIYCFGVDREAPLLVRPPHGARLAFRTNGHFTPGGGLSAADAFCQQEAAAAGLAGSFKALLASSGKSAASRFDLNGPTWARVDGVVLVEQPMDLDQPTAPFNPLAPLHVNADGTYPVIEGSAWTGAPAPGDATSAKHCNDWTSNSSSDTGTTGFVLVRDGKFFSFNNDACHQARRLYCLQQ